MSLGTFVKVYSNNDSPKTILLNQARLAILWHHAGFLKLPVIWWHVLCCGWSSAKKDSSYLYTCSYNIQMTSVGLNSAIEPLIVCQCCVYYCNIKGDLIHATKSQINFNVSFQTVGLNLQILLKQSRGKLKNVNIYLYLFYLYICLKRNLQIQTIIKINFRNDTITLT